MFDAGAMDSPTASQLKEARRAYVGAVRGLDTCLRRFDNSGIPMDPRPRLRALPTGGIDPAGRTWPGALVHMCDSGY